jgi:hypothetical protein
MRRICSTLAALALVLALAGCGTSKPDKAALALREQLLTMQQLGGTAYLTADYGVRLYEYAIDFDYWPLGELELRITAPENLSGIGVYLNEGSAALHYDGMVVSTGPLTSEGLSPLEAVPSLLRAAIEGYVAETAFEALDGAQVLRISYRSPEAQPGVGEEAALWFDLQTGLPIRGEILSDGYRVIAVTFVGLISTT